MKLTTVTVTCSRLAVALGLSFVASLPAVAQVAPVPGYEVRPPTDASLRDIQAAIFDCRPDHQIGCVFPDLIKGISSAFRFPRPIKVTVEQCSPTTAGMGAFYSPAEHGIHVCYQFGLALRNAYVAEGKTPSQAVLLATNTIVFFLTHEFGHYAIGELNLGVMGREEDAADEFATFFMVESHHPELAVDGAASCLALGKPAAGESVQNLAFWDTHSLGPQRFYDIMCSVYGSDPKRFSILVPGQLPPERSGRCEVEYARHQKAWVTALAPYSTPAAQPASSAPAAQTAGSGQARDFAGNWTGRATENTSQGVISYDASVMIDQNGRGAFAGKTKMLSPNGPVDVEVTAEGVESSMMTIQGKPTLRLVARQLVTTIKTTGERQVGVGNTYFLQRTANGITGQDITGEVKIDLIQPGVPTTATGAATVQPAFALPSVPAGAAAEPPPAPHAQEASAPAATSSQAAPTRLIPGARLFIEPTDFGMALSAAILKKNVPVVGLMDREKADFFVHSISSATKEGTGERVTKLLLFGGFAGSGKHYDATVTISNRDGAVVFAYNAQKGDFKAAAENVANEIKKAIERK